MQIQDHFIIRINEALRGLIEEYDQQHGEACPLRHVELLRKSRMGFLGKPVNNEFRTPTEVKFIFLLNLHDDYFRESQKDTPFYNFLKTLLGEHPYTERLFDQWWTIESAGSCEDIETLERLFSEKGLWNLVSVE